MTSDRCRVCGVGLDDDNWYVSFQKMHNHLCKKCGYELHRSWVQKNPDKTKANETARLHKNGGGSFNENKDCPMFLGVYVAERVLSHVFKNVERMPPNNPGYDFVCNNGYKIDVKSACSRKSSSWTFHIRHNTVADYFLCIAFDDRKNLNPLHLWLLPGQMFSHLDGASISIGTLHKWDEYKLDIESVITCCDTIRSK